MKTILTIKDLSRVTLLSINKSEKFFELIEHKQLIRSVANNRQYSRIVTEYAMIWGNIDSNNRSTAVYLNKRGNLLSYKSSIRKFLTAIRNSEKITFK